MTSAAGAATTTRNRVATTLTVGAPLSAAALLVFALFAPPAWPAWQMFCLVTAALWLAWAIWGWPAVRIDGDAVIVRNALRTWRVPLGAIWIVLGSVAALALFVLAITVLA